MNRNRHRRKHWRSRWALALWLMVASVVGVTYDPEEALADHVTPTAECPAGYSRVGSSNVCEGFTTATASTVFDSCPAGTSRVGSSLT